MKKEELAELLKYSSPWIIWVVTFDDRLIELKCPFKVVCRTDLGSLKSASQYSVSYVKFSTDLKIVFMINGSPYYYYHFDILIA